MAETTKYIANSELELEEILQEASHRWLRPVEICEILRNYKKFKLTPDPPIRPPAGSLFLFNRKALRYFRKDGHRWRKKQDGKTVREAHEKLKVGSVDALHCYYAHGEDNENFQRRSFWMLDQQLEHVVLVHYREIKEVQNQDGLDTICAQLYDRNDHPIVANTKALVEQKLKDGESKQAESGEIKKLDSFGRWMDKEIGGDCENSLMASDSGNYWSTLGAHNEDKEVSSLRHIQLDMDSLGPSLSQEQLFSIHDFSPEWAYTGVRTKVLIVGTFLGSKKLSSETKWGCMFGEIEVSAETLADNVLWCQTPLHSPGRVPFYVTCSNRLACSEVREFQFDEHPTKFLGPLGIKISPEVEVRLQIRLLKLVDLGPDNKWWKCSVSGCEKCKLKGIMCSMRGDSGVFKETFQIDGIDHINPRDVLFQRLTRDKLYEWLIYKVHEGGKGSHVLDDEGQGVIHLAAALGYVWAMVPLIAAGISPNFRDNRGRTGLHWASYFGREETVIALVKLGAAPGAVEDPTSALPPGQTAADLASSRGHKGIAGYLAEADLINRLSILTVKENGAGNIATTIATDSAFKSAEDDSSNLTMDEQHYLKESLAVFRKSAHAAASILAAFRARSFFQRQLAKSKSDVSDSVLDKVADSLGKVQNMSHFEDYLHFAALKIQKRYRGWKGRKDFLKIGNCIVKIQAHIRGHQVRKQYKKFVWSVSIVEKAILRWRRKGAGLRGFRGGQPVGIDEYDFLSVGRRQKSDDVKKALDRVKSMVRNPDARDQYMRLTMKYQKFKIVDSRSIQSHVD
ncbi:calmodulin-binding transcription activator 2-like isoform X3 [Vigna unguiculata]|uniref:calmodulin-binding transcription activator 2-like isoform X3 n=1 Tax=Vigna unguiculata TaxID=3917 RepID=UPI001015D992|nr:calmodulin-binding transcription activator 2-like isoform X3 [Vigna unguiculata]